MVMTSRKRIGPTFVRHVKVVPTPSRWSESVPEFRLHAPRLGQHSAEVLREAGLHFVESGTSGGIWGEANGYCVMVGGSDEAVVP